MAYNAAIGLFVETVCSKFPGVRFCKELANLDDIRQSYHKHKKVTFLETAYTECRCDY